MFKTLYSRYGNVKSGKFVAGAGDEGTEEFEALNDIEKVLHKIGISMRDTSAEFRNFDDVLAEIAKKWATLNDVERNAISTAFAGTRQREIFNILMSNFDQVSKFERIAENSAGSTAQKMDIYGDSLEASKARVIAATESLTQDLFGGNTDEALKEWNNTLAYIIKNAKTLVTTFLALTFITKGLTSGSMFGGLAKLMQSLVVSAANFNTTMSTVGTNIIKTFTGLYRHPIAGLPLRVIGESPKVIGAGIKGYRTAKASAAQPTETAYVDKGNQILTNMSTPRGSIDRSALLLSGTSGISGIAPKFTTSASRMAALPKEPTGLKPIKQSTQSAGSAARKEAWGAFRQNVLISDREVGGAFKNWRDKTENQIQAQNTNRLYSTAFKAGVSQKMDAVQADQSARFIASLSPEQLKKYNAMSVAEKEAIAKALDEDAANNNPLIQSNTELRSSIDNLASVIKKQIGQESESNPNTSKDDETDSKTGKSSEQPQDKTKTSETSVRDRTGRTIGKVRTKKDTTNVEETKKTLQLRKRENASINKRLKVTKQDTEAIRQDAKIKKEDTTSTQNNITAKQQNISSENQETAANFNAAQSEIFQAAKAHGVSGDAVRGANIITKDPAVQQNMKSRQLSTLGQGIKGVGSMALMMGGSIAGQAAASNSGNEWTAYTGMGAGLLASTGLSMLGTGVGALPGAIMLIGATILGVATVLGGLNKSAAKIKEEAEEAKDKLSEGTNAIKELATEIENLKKQSADFNKLASGVDPETGENVSLTDDEFNQYQDQLKDIIDAREGLYASYNKEGDLIAMRNGQILKSNEIMKESIKMAEQEQRVKAQKMMTDPQTKENFKKLGTDLKTTINDNDINNLKVKIGGRYENVDTEVFKDLNSTTVDVGMATADSEVMYQDANGEFREYKGMVYYDTKSKEYKGEGNISLYNGNEVNSNTYSTNLDISKLSTANTDIHQGLSKAIIQYAQTGDKAAFINYISNPANKITTEQIQYALNVDTDIAEALLNGEISEEVNEAVKKSDAAKQVYGSEFTTLMNNAVQMSDNFYKLTPEQQSMLLGSTTGIKLAPLSDAEYESYVKKFSELSDILWNDKNLQNALSKYNVETATQGSYDDRTSPTEEGTAQYHLAQYKKLYGNVDENNNVTDPVARQMYINAGFNFIGNELVTQQEYLARSIQEKYGNDMLHYNESGSIWRNFTQSELSTIYENYNLIAADNQVKNAQNSTDRQNAIKRKVQEINMESYSVQQLFGVLESDIDRFAKEAKDLWYGDLAEGIDLYEDKLLATSKAYEKLSEMTKRLGLESVQDLAKMAKGLKLDQFGYSLLSMSEIEKQFSQLQSIRNTLAHEGTISSEDWDYLATNFSHIIAQATTDGMIDAIDAVQDAKDIQIRAKITGTFADDSDLYRQFADELINVLPSVSKDLTSIFGGIKNFKQIEGIQSALNLAGDNKEEQQKQLATFFDIAIDDKNDWKTTLENTIHQNYGKDISIEEFIENIIGFGSVVGEAWTTYTKPLVDAQMEMQKLKQDNEAFSNDLEKLKTRYQQGAYSAEEYLKSLESLQGDTRASAEQLRELVETIEDATFNEISTQFEKGAISVSHFREELVKLMSTNAIGSEDWNQYLTAYLSSFDTESTKLQNKLEMLNDDDYVGQLNVTQQQINTKGQKLAAIEAAGIAQYGDQYNREEDANWLTAQSDLLKSYQQLSQILNSQINDLKTDYQQGRIGRDALRRSYVDLSKSMHITQEDFESLSEAIEQLDFEVIKEQFQDGILSGSQYRDKLSELMKQNDMGSEQYKQYRGEFLNSFDVELQISEQRASVLADTDFTGKSQFLLEDINILKSQAAALEAAELQESEQYYAIISKIVAKEKERLDLKKSQLEYEVNSSKEVLDAYTNILNYNLKEIQQRQQDINNMYDDEISKLQDINDQKQRSVELTKLQQELENAKKEKTRVYTAGIGWTYQENKAKVKEAKQNLDNYLDERKLKDLQFAQKKQNELFEDQIERIQKIQDYISKITERVNANAGLMDLIKNGVLPDGSTLDDAIFHIMNGVAYGEKSNISHLDATFESYASKFTFTSDELNALLDNYDAALYHISNEYMKYTNDKAMVTDFKTQLWSDYNSKVKPNKQTFEQTIKDFINGTGSGYKKWKDDITKIFQDNKPVVNVNAGQTVDLSAIEKAINQANTWLSELVSQNVLMVDGKSTTKQTYDGRYLSSKSQEINGVTYITNDSLDGWYSTAETDKVKKNKYGYTIDSGATRYQIRGFSSGIENGPVAYTGLAMLHGTPSSPEYVLNSDQAGTLLKNLATMTMSPYQAPQVDSYGNQSQVITYQFNGDMNLPNVQRPDQFFNELLKQANVQFPTIKQNYR